MSDVLQALRSMIFESGDYAGIADRARQELGWRCSQKSAESRIAQWMNPSDPHRFPVEFLPALIEETGRDYITPVLQRVLIQQQISEQRTEVVSLRKRKAR